MFCFLFSPLHKHSLHTYIYTMLKQAVTKATANVSKVAVTRARLFSSAAAEVEAHRKKNPDENDIKDQSLFDANKKRLEEMERDSQLVSLKEPGERVLQERGSEAELEQNRPDDGVY